MFCFSIYSLGNAQDIIITKDAQKIEAKILEVSKGEIKYKKQNNLNGPTFVISTDELNSIMYANGEVQVFTLQEQIESMSETESVSVSNVNNTNTYRDWNNWLDYIHINTPVNIMEYETLYIYPVDISKVRFPDQSDNQYPALVNSLRLFPYIVQQELIKKYPHLKVIVVENPNSVSMDKKSLKLNLAIVELVMGSRTARFWVGFGAGSQRIKISGIVSNQKQADLFDFQHQRVSINSKTYEKCLSKEFKNFGEDIVRIFEAFRNYNM